MVIINPSNATQPAAFNRPAGPAPILPTDKVLNAVVMGQRADHLYELAAGNLRLMAESQTALRRGEQLLLQVTGKDALQRPILQVINTSPSAINPMLKAMLPQQQGINQLLANMHQLISSPASYIALSKASTEFLDTLPSRQHVSNPAGLLNAIQSSGFFMESNLAAGIAPPGDLKTALLRLAQKLENLRLSNAASPPPSKPAKLSQDYSGLVRGTGAKIDSSLLASGQTSPDPTLNSQKSRFGSNINYNRPIPNSDLPGVLRSQPRLLPELRDLKLSQEALIKQLLQDSRGAIARLESHQLLHLQQKDPLQNQCLIELPVRDDDGIDVWQLQLQWQRAREEQEQSSENSTSDTEQYQRRWQVNLNFELPGLGAIDTLVSQQGKQIAIRFNTEIQATRSLIDAHQNELSQRLTEQGLIDTEIQTHTGITPAPGSPLISQSLLEDQA
ncbi:flagellar hook-length control protein FliK [Zhongshania sp.]|uniref:flagellar hook-length control protein FliK n=1 Tax=Zhongshania sp. TaxID=1971902 RepID=UPI0035635F2A